MTTRTRNSIRITSADLRAAADLALNSLPCEGTLRQDVMYKDNPAIARCIMGCVVEAVAQRRHISFDKAKELMNGEGASGPILEVCGVEVVKSLTGREYDSLVLANDDEMPVRGLDYNTGTYVLDARAKEIKQAQKWQARTLNKLAAKLEKSGKSIPV